MFLFALFFIVGSFQLISAYSQCSLYGLCDGEEGRTSACVAGHGPRMVESDKIDEYSLQSFKDFCSYNLQDNLCCNSDQIIHMVSLLDGDLRTRFGHCSTCYANIAALFCTLTCNPNQSNFVSADSVYGWNPTTVVVKVKSDYVSELFESCRYVQHHSNKSKTALDDFCKDPPCTYSFNFVRKLLWDYLTPAGQTTIWLVGFHPKGIGAAEGEDGDALEATVIPCNETAKAFSSPCRCQDCSPSDISCPLETSEETPVEAEAVDVAHSITPELTTVASGARELCGYCSFVRNLIRWSQE